MKLARKQFIKGPIIIRNTIKHVFTNKSLEEDLALGAPLIDTTSLSYMKDFYAIKIFSLENVIKLLEKEKNDKSIYLLPFALWQESLMSTTLKKKTRLLFLEIAFQIFYHFYYQLKYSKFEKGITVYKSQYSKALYINNENFLIRCMNTTLFTYSSIYKYEPVCLHRIGSHPVENYFGNIRIICRNYDSFENFVRAAIQTFTNMSIKSKFQIVQKVKNRINIAGINLMPNFGSVEFDENICSSIDVVANIFNDSKISIANYNEKDINKQNYLLFIDFISNLVYKKKRTPNAFNRPKVSSGSLIQSRCFGAYFEKN